MMEALRSRITTDAELTERETEIVRMWNDLRGKTYSPNRQQLIAALLEEMGLENARLVFDDGRVMAEVNETLPGIEAIEGVNIFREIKVIKTAREVEILRRAAQINEAALMALVAAATPGTMMRELKRVWFTSMASQGATGIELPLAGLDRPWQMYADTTYRLQPGDHLNVDVAGTFERYWGDTGRTVTIGPPTTKVAELFSLLEECHARVVPNLRPGTTTAEIVSIAADAVKSGMPEGFAPVVHSIGNEVYDQPATYGSLYSDSFMLERGMVVNFESLYFEYPWGALQLENTYYLGEHATEQLTSLPNGPLRAASE
jgi:Xaa-Pro aminopeptidase